MAVVKNSVCDTDKTAFPTVRRYIDFGSISGFRFLTTSLTCQMTQNMTSFVVYFRLCSVRREVKC